MAYTSTVERCAQHIANEMAGVRDRIRNVQHKPSSFSLPTSAARFYPDFLIRLDNGAIIAAEYKGTHIATGKDSDEKKRIGELWEWRSGGRYALAWVELQDSTTLKQAVTRCKNETPLVARLRRRSFGPHT